MGAIQKGGFEFDVEFSQIAKRTALHVYKNGEFKQEITFPFKGVAPESSTIEKEIDAFLRSQYENPEL